MVQEGRKAGYERIISQLEGLIVGKSPNLISAMSTICAVLHAKMKHHFWTGFYFVRGSDELHVGPYQGPLACQILKGKGVCLQCSTTKKAVVVPNVDLFPDHIACDSRSKSEIATPLSRGGIVIAVLDIDSDRLAQFDEDDVEPLSQILALTKDLE